MSRSIRVLGQNVSADDCTEEEYAYLSRFDGQPLELQRVWELMDEEWRRCGAGYGPECDERVGRFYASPVWLLNGLFTESDPESVGHREAMADWVGALEPRLVADYGGGFGALARRIARVAPQADVVVVDPFARETAIKVTRTLRNVRFAPALPTACDAVIAQDVLEHVRDPLPVFRTLLEAVRPGGRVVTANCFQPVILCHMPQTFHLRFTFRFIVPALGCRYVGTVPGAPHAQVFERTTAEPSWRRARARERISRIVFPLLLCVAALTRPIRSRLRRQRSR